MPYTGEQYAKALKILEKRRDKAELKAEIAGDEIKKKLPEINEIQAELSKVGMEISKLFFYQGDGEKHLAELKEKSQALVAKRSAILTMNGYSENALKPEYMCPVCEDKGFIGGRMCACHLQLLKELMRQEVSRFAPLDKCSFDNFKLDYYSAEPLPNSVVPRYRAEKVLEAARRYAQSFNKNSKNLLFLGSTGLGKTHLSLAIANVVIERGYSVCYGTSQNICEDMRAEMFGRDAGLSYTKDSVLDVDLLILDDLGCEIDNKYNTASIYNIINSRILSGKPTIISTNYEIDELLEKYDQRITSRITGEYTALTLFGRDIRTIK
jgi:DNA replication protein DnaC